MFMMLPTATSVQVYAALWVALIARRYAMDNVETAQEFCARTISGLTKKADHNKNEALYFFLTVIVATLATPLFVTLGDGLLMGKIVPSILSLLAAASTAWLQLRKPQQLWAIYRTAQRELEDQQTRHRFKLTPYDVLVDADKELAGHVAKIALQAHHKWLPMIPNPENLRVNQHEPAAIDTDIENSNVSQLPNRQKPT
jgi:hypothetical protein